MGQNTTVVQSGNAFFVKGKLGATSSNFTFTKAIKHQLYLQMFLEEMQIQILKRID